MKFGQKIVALQHHPWTGYYLDYNGLKDVLEQPVKDDHSLASGNVSLTSATLASIAALEHPASSRFLEFLDKEVEKIVLFFLQEQGRIAYQLVELRRQQLDPGADRRSIRERYHSVGASLLHLIQYVDLNVTGVRKILKKHDKLRHWNASKYYLGSNKQSSVMLGPLIADDALAVLCATLETGLQELRLQEEQESFALTSMDLSPFPTPVVTASKSHQRSATEPQIPAGSALHRRIQSNLSRDSYLGMQPHPEDMILAHIYAARRRLKQSSGFVQMLAATALFEAASEGEGEEEEDAEVPAGPSVFSNLLNLASTALYMTNYYIVVPTSSTYSVKLGSNSALASMIVGMTPIAALVSTLLYSWWTSYSYKSALIFASSCSIIGNLFYASGLPFHSLALVMIGRLLNGFGSARSINRRYIADTFPRAERTAASAAFVSAGAIGMAAGPAIASILHLAADDSLSVYWQVENAPGWFMSVVWSVYLVLLIFYFEDPPKRSKPVTPSKVEMTTGERRPLLGNGSSVVVGEDEPPLWKNVAVIMTFLIYFVLKLLLECVLSSTGMLTEFYFDLSASLSGVYLAALGLLMLPANFLVASLSRTYEDRELITGMQAVMVLGCLVIINYTTPERYSIIQYMLGSVVIFLSTNMLEGPNMSLLSKTIPRSMSEGFFNVGLLATEAGTLGRAVGDVFLTLCGAAGMEYLLNNTFLSTGALSLLTLILSYLSYGHLQPLSEKDD